MRREGRSGWAQAGGRGREARLAAGAERLDWQQGPRGGTGAARRASGVTGGFQQRKA